MSRTHDIATKYEVKRLREAAGSNLLVVDVRSETRGSAAAPSAKLTLRWDRTSESMPYMSVTLPWDRTTNTMALPAVHPGTAIVTHCTNGTLGQMAKNYLIQHGFTKVLNGGGIKEMKSVELW